MTLVIPKNARLLGTYMDINSDGFETWYRSEHPRVLAALSVVARDPDLAEEVTIEAVARALQGAAQVRDVHL